MALDPHFLLSMPPLVISQRLSTRDTLLYSLGVGAGLACAGDDSCRKFVYEKELVPLSTMATVLAYPGFWAQDPKYGITWRKLLHRDQSVEIHSELPVEGDLRAEMSIDNLFDRGSEKGALLCFSRRIHDANTGALYATVRQVNVLRADGGFGGSPDALPPPKKAPEREPDSSVSLSTGVDQALIFRLSGDYNPLHVDPAVAQAAGFDRPILHGLSTFGVAGLAITIGCCNHNARRLRRLSASFSSPVYPGETLNIRIWNVGTGSVYFEGRVVERDVTVLKSGYAEFLT